jgi:hypothetical protein
MSATVVSSEFVDLAKRLGISLYAAVGLLLAKFQLPLIDV